MTDLTDALPCPFCGSTHLHVVDWYDDERGEFDAIECDDCLGAAPATIWNSRSRNAAIEAAPTTITAEEYTPPSWDLVEVRVAAEGSQP